MTYVAHFSAWSLGLAKAQSQTNDDERNCVTRHAVGRKRLAEVGVYQGVTTRRIRGAMDPSAVLYAIDPFPRGRLGISLIKPIARGEVGRIGNGRVEWLRMTGEDAARYLAGREPLDFVFIDGDHSYEGLRVDYEGFRPLMAKNGIIALHDSMPTDVCPADAGSVRFVRDVIMKDPSVERIEVVDSLTVWRKR